MKLFGWLNKRKIYLIRWYNNEYIINFENQNQIFNHTDAVLIQREVQVVDTLLLPESYSLKEKAMLKSCERSLCQRIGGLGLWEEQTHLDRSEIQ